MPGIIKQLLGQKNLARDLETLLVLLRQQSPLLSAKQGTQALAGGTAVILSTAVTANSLIHLTAQNTGAAQGELYISARVAGTSFTITSANGADNRTIAWLLYEPT